MPKKWYDTFYTYVWVFNTGRGLAVCIRFPHNVGILYDLGKDEAFSPLDFITQNIAPKLQSYNKFQIAQCVLSHPHMDHITEIEKLSKNGTEKSSLYPSLITCPNDKVENESVDFARILNEDNRDLINTYRECYSKRIPPLQTIQSLSPCNVPNVEYGLYYMVPPVVSSTHQTSDQDYGNGVSILLYLRHGNQTLMLTGDVTPDVLRKVLECDTSIERRYTSFSGSLKSSTDWHERTSNQPKLKELLKDRGLSVLVAPHHGLESGFCPELLAAIKGGKPMINVISEKRHLSDQDGQVEPRYQDINGAFGINVNIEGKNEQRYSVSTRDGHHILIIFRGTDLMPYIFLRKDPMQLLNIA